MLFLGIDQHTHQLTISLRDQHGDVLLARQVSTQPENMLEFFYQLMRKRKLATVNRNRSRTSSEGNASRREIRKLVLQFVVATGLVIECY